MSASNSIHIMGRITRDLELKYTASGVAVCAFAVAVSRSYKDSNGNYPADFIDCVAWRTTAEFVTKHFRKGAMIAISGELQTRMYTDKDGNKRKAVETLVNSVAFTGEKADGAGSGSTRPPMPTTPPPVAAEEPTYDEIEYSVNDEDLPF